MAKLRCKLWLTPTVAFAMLLILLQVAGCAPVIVAGAATGASLANDRRTAGTIIDDQGIEMRASNALYADKLFDDQTNISVISYNRVVLLTGQVQSEQQRTQAVQVVRQAGNIKTVHNELTLGPAIDYKARNHDTWLTTKIKKALIQNPQVAALQIKVVSENSQVYLMGLVTRAEAREAAQTAQQVEGVQGVITVFEYLD